MGTFFFFVLAVMSLAGFTWLGIVKAKQRRELLVQFAASQGWTWTERDDSWAARFVDRPFGQGDNRKARNVLQGICRGRPMVAFDYSYETHSTDSKGNRTTSTHRFSFCALELPFWVPRTELVPEGPFGRIGTALGMKDLELESEDFNRRYRVRTDNPKFAYDVLPPRTMEGLLTRPALRIRLSGTDAVSWDDGRHDPAALLARLDALTAVIDGIPEFVWSDLKGTTP